MFQKIAFAALALAAVVTTSAHAYAHMYDRLIEVINESDTPIYSLYASNVSDPEWSNVLG